MYIIKTIAIDEDVDIDAEKKISLNDLVHFCTGSLYILPSMIAKGKISFVHPSENERGKRLIVSTCALLLRFPVTARYAGSVQAFVENVCDDIISAPDFSLV